MNHLSTSLGRFVNDLVEIGSIKFGDFMLGNNEPTTVYFDLRLIPSYPSIMKRVVDLISAKIINHDLKYDIICGVPFAAISFASCISVELNKGMILKRHSMKKYGTQKLIEGHWRKGMKCLIIEDVVVQGNSIKDVVEDLRNNGIIVEDAVTILDREEGGVDYLWNTCNVRLHSVVTCRDIYNVIKNDEMSSKLLDFINLKCCTPNMKFEIPPRGQINKAGSELWKISKRKRTNIILAVDFDDVERILSMIDTCADYICGVKLHSDVVGDFDDQFVGKIVELANTRDFLLIEDRKLCDLGETVLSQYTRGNVCMSNWAHLVTVHGIFGDNTVEEIKNGIGDNNGCRGCLLISEMSSNSSFKSSAYRTNVLKLAQRHSDFVAGFICQERLTDNGQFINVTPGVRLETNNDSLDQVYSNPVENNSLSDFYVVGRGITETSNPLESVIHYRDHLYHY